MCGFAADFNVLLIECNMRSNSGFEPRYGVAVFKSVSGASLDVRSQNERSVDG